MAFTLRTLLALGLFSLSASCHDNNDIWSRHEQQPHGSRADADVGHHHEQLQHDSRQAAVDDGYIGYRLDQRGDPDSAVYETAETNTAADTVLPQEPDVYLNANVSVGEIDIEVDNITAKVNLQADVLKLLHFSAGVDASIDRVRLTIQNVSAKVVLEARLENVVAM